MSKRFFGTDCPGCGTQRALALILKGDFTEAFFMYPAIYTLLLFFGFVFLNFTDKRRNYHPILISLGIINGIIIIVAYIYKLLNT